MRKQTKRKARLGLDEYGRTALHYAALDGDHERVRELVDAGADPSAQDDDGRTGLHFAAQERSPGATEILLKAGADTNLVDIHGNGPLWTAIMNCRGDRQIIELLLEHGADPDQANRYGASPASLATEMGYELR